MNVASESASKKRKINETDSPADVPKAPEEARQRFQDLWHEDGSVVIQTKDAEFCVHRTVVSLHSPVLRAKLDALFASTRRDVYDGSAQSVVTLQVEDRGYDLSAILSIMYQGGKRCAKYDLDAHRLDLNHISVFSWGVPNQPFYSRICALQSSLASSIR